MGNRITNGGGGGAWTLLSCGVCTYFLRAARVDHLGVMLRLLSVLPGEIHNEFAGILVMASINRLNVVFP